MQQAGPPSLAQIDTAGMSASPSSSSAPATSTLAPGEAPPPISAKAKGKKRARETDETEEMHLSYIPEHDMSLYDFTEAFWKRQFHVAETVQDPFRLPELPLARVKRVMKTDPEVAMIASEVPVILEKACQIFISDLTARAYIDSTKRRTLTKQDIAKATKQSDIFDFLIDVVPGETVEKKEKPAKGGTGGGSASSRSRKQSDEESEDSKPAAPRKGRGKKAAAKMSSAQQQATTSQEGQLPPQASTGTQVDHQHLPAANGAHVAARSQAQAEHAELDESLLNFDAANDVTLPADFSEGIFGLNGWMTPGA